MAVPKKKADDGRKQVPLRVGTPNWRRVQLAKIDSGLSLQELMYQAVDLWLRKHKYEGLQREDGE